MQELTRALTCGTLALCMLGLFLFIWMLLVLARIAKEKREKEDPDNFMNHY